MLSADVRLEGFTQSDWAKVLSLFRPRATPGKERDPERPRGGIIAIHEGGRLRKLLHTQAGRLRLEDARAEWPLSCEELAVRNHASWACKIESGALENLMDRFGARLRRGDDMTAQTLLFANLIRDEMLARRIELFPARLSGMPMPTLGMVDRTLDAVCPRGHAILLGLFEGGELWTSCALRRGSSGGFDWILGPDEIRRDMGLLAGDWRRDYRHLSRAVERKIGKLSLGVYAETTTFRSLEVDGTPGAWARAVAIRDVILAPVPVALAIPLGIDAGRAAVSALGKVADRAEGLAVVSPLLGALRGVVQQAAQAAGLLHDDDDGPRFDPLELLRRLLARDR